MTDSEIQFYACGCSAQVTYERDAAGNIVSHSVLESHDFTPCQAPTLHP